MSIYKFTNTGYCMRRDEKPKPRGDKYKALQRPKPQAYHNSYSNPESQGALICQTANWRDWYDSETEEFFCAYSDRIREWDRKRYQKACTLAGRGDDSQWAQTLPQLSDEKFREFAKVALGLEVDPIQVQCVHYYNVATGYSCPTVAAVFLKQANPQASP